MLVKEYALDVNLSVAEILKKCNELGIKVSSGNDELTDDDIIMLDNTINIISTNDDITFDEDEEIDEKVDEIISSENFDRKAQNSTSKQKLKKKDSINKNNEFSALKKEMYKHKSKLKTNDAIDNIVLYKDGMTLYELASEIKINPAELIKKLIGLGLMLTINDKIDFINTIFLF